METNYKDIHDLISECQRFSGVLNDAGPASALAAKLSICRVTYRIFFRGVSSESEVIYTAPGAKNGECYDYQMNTSDSKVVTLKIHRFDDAPLLDTDSKYLFDIFSQSVLSGVCVRNLINAYENLLYHDTMTGITNVVFFRKVLEEIISEERQSEYSVGYVNIKNCKTVNRIFGSELGDLIIKDFSQEANSFIDPKQKEVFSRLGGDNFIFCVLNSNLDRMLQFLTAANINIIYKDDIVDYTLSCRVGVVRLGNEHLNVGMVLTNASSTYLMTKKDKSPDIVFFTGSTNSILFDQQNYAEEIKRDLLSGKFLVYYQPIITNEGEGTLRMTGAEALVRWNHSGSIVNPLSFIPVAENHNIIGKIDIFVLEKTCAKMREWIDDGLNVVPISFNFSKNDLAISDLTDQIINIVDKYGIDHQLINIEFTEAAYHEEYETVYYATQKLVSAGIRVSIDNFGKGYSSLLLLGDFDFDFLKIDHSIVNSTTNKGKIIFENIVKMAVKLGYTVVCEGIESRERIMQAIDSGCTLFQTDMYDKALSERFFVSRLKNPVY